MPVIFYATASDDLFANVAIKLCEKLYENGENTLFLCKDEEEVRSYDNKLWTYSKLSFTPHGSKFSIESGWKCNIWLSTNIEFTNKPKCLLHNGLKLDSDISDFEKIIDIFCIDNLDAAKDRKKFYGSKGFDDIKLWLQKGSGWKQSTDLG